MAWSRFSPTLHHGIAKNRQLDRALRRELKNDRAFTFHHIWSQNWVLAFHSDRFGEKGIHEFHILNNDPERKDGPKVERGEMAEIRKKWFRPTDFDGTLRRIQSEQWDQQVAEYERNEELTRMKQSERKRLNSVQRDDPYWKGDSERPKAW